LNLQLTCRYGELSDAVREYATRKAERLERRFDGIHGVEMILGVEGGKPKVEIIVSAVRGQKCVAGVTHEDLFGAIDLVVDKIDRQLKRLKDRLHEHHGKRPEPPAQTEE